MYEKTVTFIHILHQIFLREGKTQIRLGVFKKRRGV